MTPMHWLPPWGRGLLVVVAPLLMGLNATAIAVCEPRPWVIVLAGVATILTAIAALAIQEPWMTAALAALVVEVLIATDDTSRLRSLLIVVLGAPALFTVHTLFALRASTLPGAPIEVRVLHAFARRALRASWLGMLLAPGLLALSWIGPTAPVLGGMAVLIAAVLCTLLFWPERRAIARGPR
jgi:hypothetical protein